MKEIRMTRELGNMEVYTVYSPTRTTRQLYWDNGLYDGASFDKTYVSTETKEVRSVTYCHGESEYHMVETLDKATGEVKLTYGAYIENMAVGA